MRRIGTQAFGIRLPIINRGDNLADIVVDSLMAAVETQSLHLKPTDVVGITEALLAKAQGNFATIDAIGEDIRQKFPDGVVGLVFPIFSRNRFLNILKGIARGAKKVYVLLQYPHDEVGNPLMRLEDSDKLFDTGKNFFPGDEFREIAGNFTHPFTSIDYISLYQNVGSNVEVHVSNDPRRILELTKHVLVGEIHCRMRTKERLQQAGAETVYTLSDILSKPINGSGFNPDFGVLGSNLSTEEELKLFPRDSEAFVNLVQEKIAARSGIAPQVMVYGDGAFKDPQAGIWELADPVVSPGYTRGLEGRPNEIKIKYVAENLFKGLSGEEKTVAISEMIREKRKDAEKYSINEGTTPRNYTDLLGSLCDLISGSGDKGTPVVLIQGYFDDYSCD
jgi:F420-0:Gamma-glutamyl ligase.